MNQVNGHKLGIVLGGFGGFMHLLWSFLVAVGWAQPIMNFAYGMHFINPIQAVTSFNIVTAVGLVLLASLIGYAMGRMVALIWNYVHM